MGSQAGPTGSSAPPPRCRPGGAAPLPAPAAPAGAARARGGPAPPGGRRPPSPAARWNRSSPRSWPRGGSTGRGTGSRQQWFQPPFPPRHRVVCGAAERARRYSVSSRRRRTGGAAAHARGRLPRPPPRWGTAPPERPAPGAANGKLRSPGGALGRPRLEVHWLPRAHACLCPEPPPGAPGFRTRGGPSAASMGSRRGILP